ncbi:MAG: nucleotide exchange factor GrpE [Myxococcota bacterium]
MSSHFKSPQDDTTTAGETSAADSQRNRTASDRRDTAPDAVPPEMPIDPTVKTVIEVEERQDFDEVMDTEVDFDALRAVQELEESIAVGPPVGSAEDSGDEATKEGSTYIGILESEVEQLTALVADKERELGAVTKEADKARERLERDTDRQLESRTRKLLLGFIEILDDLERALASAREMDHNPAVVDGIELVHKRFMAKLREFGVSHKPSAGEVFDPNIHEAMSVVPTSDPAQNGVIVGVIREGYMIGEETLRPAGVAVGKSSS